MRKFQKRLLCCGIFLYQIAGMTNIQTAATPNDYADYSSEDTTTENTTDYDARITSLEAAVINLQKQVASLQAQLQVSNNTVAIDPSNTSYSNNITANKSAIASSSSQTVFNEQIAKLQEQNAALQKDIAQRQAIINDLSHKKNYNQGNLDQKKIVTQNAIKKDNDQIALNNQKIAALQTATKFS